MSEKTKIRFSILAIVAIVILCIGISPIGLQNDTFYTVKIGEHILENGIDGKDPFSWHAGLTYTYPHWLYDVIMYLIYQFGGWNAVYLSTVILCCTLGLVLYYTNQKTTKKPLVSFILTLGVMYFIKSYIAARAQLPTFILFVLSFYWIERFLQTKKKRYAVGLMLISLLIANLHVAVWPFFFVLFMPYIAEYLCAVIRDSRPIYHIKKIWYKINIKIRKNGEKKKQYEIKKIEYDQLAEKIYQSQLEKRKDPYKIILKRNSIVKWLILVLLLCALMGLITPLGDTPYTYLIKTMQGNTTQNINEHLPLTLYNQKDILCVMAVFIAILLFTKVKIKLSDLFLVAGLVYLCLMSRRQISMFLILGVFVLNRLICYFLDRYDLAQKDQRKAINLMTTITGQAVVLLLVISISYSVVGPRIKGKEKYVSTTTYPVEASQYLLENLDLGKLRLYNEYNYGSYLLYRGIPVFIDSRADLYTPEFNEGKNIFQDFLNISNISTYYETKFKEYDITHVIVYKNAKLNMFLARDRNYKELYSDTSFVIYERQTVS